jgi:nucleoside-diphosphate-sugar epimerase
MTRVLVTGAYGCIGAWVVRDLVRRDVDVIAHDIGDDPRRMALVMEPDELDGVTRVRGDITDLAALETLIDAHEVTNIIHLAALQVPFCREDPVRGAQVNVVGTVNVFEAVARRADRMGPVVYASSVAAYDAIDSGSVPAMSSIPGTLYGVYKRANEGTAAIYGAERGVSSVGLRPHTVYGPGRDQGLTSAPTAAMLAAAAGVPYRIPYGGRSQFQYAPDVARAFVQAALVGRDGATVHNLAGEAVAMDGVVAAIEAAAPAAAGLIEFDDVLLPFPSEVDATSLAETIGVVAELPFAEGVADAVARFRRLLADGRVTPGPSAAASASPVQ